ncbi:MAG TPA: EAL domain-containing protein [Sphingobium sp.]|uniref:sensor domain-containing protein n=1 Tax=Sphingobium sp. TaxID=1912891 RepID=UPI002ED2018E
MDYFVGRRFGETPSEAGHAASQPRKFLGRNNIAFSPLFDPLLPAVVRWIADRRGRLRQLEAGSTAFGRQCESDVAAHGWLALFDPRDLRLLVRAVACSPHPDPMIVTLRLGDGPRRALVRVAQARGPEGESIWIGTVEDIQSHDGEETRELEAALRESEQHYRASVDLSPMVPWTAAPDGAIQEVGPLWERLTGMRPEQALGAGWIDALHPEDVPGTLALWTKKLESGAPVDVTYRVRSSDGRYRWMRARAAARRDASGNIIRWYGTLEDVHAAHLAEQALAESEERFRLAVQSARLGIWDYDAITGIQTWSDEFKRMLGISLDEAATTELALSLVHDEDCAKFRAMVQAVAELSLPPYFEATFRIYRSDTGAMRWIKSTGWITQSDSGCSTDRSPVGGSDAGRVTRVIVTFQDVTEQRNAEDRIRWAATHDPLTNLPNRALWQERLEAMTTDAKGDSSRFGLMLFDIDELKRANDTLGHDAGDALLCNFAERLQASAPPDALVGRLGGDEFGLVAASLADGRVLQQCAARLLINLRRPYAYDGQALECGVSIGGAVFGEHGDNAQDLLKAADLALYASKASGRGRLTLFHSELRAEAQQRSSMIQLAREAVEHDLILPFYQPRVDLNTGQVLGYEALLRWKHARLGIQLPGSIAAAFGHAEIAVALTEKMLGAVTHDIREWLDAGFDPGRVAINASSADFMRGDFADYILDTLSRTGVPTANFEIEVTETVFLGRGAEHVEHILAQFSRAGVRIALDDFGTGYASLSHLKNYPVDVLKIDRSFVRNLEQDSGDAAIVDAIVKLGTSLGIEIVAEGVETEMQKAILLGHGCTIAQGFLLGRPAPKTSIIR